ncbi:glycosyltransferase family protein [Clostridium neonatale]|uniref:hypothetical protein n=1 Tax=Clostridium neonatale TaxID=137838 RepID=UPI00291C19FB|nr:galactofuranosylgalactofuranosylrhamnosyl-N-acetylglucosaminyl-diphospho-decaprenol beta-1,5/1,6-galactofuranosyltransferase [Clostridium neonatale]CAI3686367.1 galactofuranosylgalactofuranosylrhamnosyl-N-acetylglucosaminyl-diphospho-decaprenol beta-1,5/1,6-galactofuranosyltransferase [Clostridium neonatale]CAI3716309.1 galactofuranosylgalactofuranosylrhamnosyl-N-acetylglucosaminyl-diphospho-decaprenol beta-1,5/1,6-galactofuranosyltransferase [Clostridium neonatale]
MNLQNIIFPTPGVCYEEEMFYHRDYDKTIYNPVENCIIFEKDGIVKFDSYFNSFSICKWAKYTKIENVSLKLNIEGAFLIKLFNCEKKGEALQVKNICVIKSEDLNKKEVVVEFPGFYQNGVHYFELQSLEDDCKFYGGEYFTTIADTKINKVNIAINMCSYKREKYVYRTVELLNKSFFENCDSELKEHLELYIIDNGESIDKKIESEKIHLFRQGDYGGAGGFTRGLMEILNDKNKYDFTHVIMMDDDILIQKDSIIKTYAFLKVIKEEYKSSFIGGALLRTDMQYLQYISGGHWDTEKFYVMHNLMRNLKEFDDVIANEMDSGAQINGWWYHCIPIDVINDRNLPNPVFFHMDDVEYDLRNCKHLILLNGICTWHEPFEYKPSSYVKYFNTRNVAITHAIHYKNFDVQKMINFVKDSVHIELSCFRYKDADLVLRGVEDFMKGINWIKETEPISLFEDTLECGYKKVDIKQLPIRFNLEMYQESIDFKESRIKSLIRKYTKNGHLLRANCIKIVPMFVPNPSCFYRAKSVLHYDAVTEKGFITDRSYKELIRIYNRRRKVINLIKKDFNRVALEYRQHINELRTREFWDMYLKIK